MAHSVYPREDYLVTMRRTSDGGANVNVAGQGRLAAQYEFTKSQVATWIDAAMNSAVPELAGLPALLDSLAPQGLPSDTIERIVLRIDDSALAALPWETFIESIRSPAFPRRRRPIVVRTSPTRASIADQPLTLPLRLVETETLVPGTPPDGLAGVVLPIFGTHDPARVARAVRIESVPLRGLAAFQLSDPLFPVDIVHVWDPYFPDDPADLTRASRPDVTGTLGWAMRLMHESRCRLIVFLCGSERNARRARLLGTAVVARGGPAILVLRRTLPSELQVFYRQLMHNFPLDLAASLATSRPQTLSLFAGGGREEALRFTRLGEELSGLARKLVSPSTDVPDESLERLRYLLSSSLPRWTPLDAAPRAALQQFIDEWPRFRFEEHEGQGLLPLADSTLDLYKAVFFAQPQQQQQQQEAAPPGRVERYVNTAVWSEGDDEQPVPLEQRTARLSRGQRYHLQISIGRQDFRVRTIGATPVPEQVFEWRPEIRGAWLEVAVTGLECDVEGDPVRELWLPQSGDSDSLYYAFRPTTAFVARLRFCVYFRGNVVQSFRVAFLMSQTGRRDPSAAVRRRRLARAVRLPETTVPDVGFLPRLEYSLGQTGELWTSRPERGLSLVANDLDGKPVITIKGADAFGVATPGNLARYVGQLRSALQAAGTAKFSSGEQYRFGLAGDANLGKPEDLRRALALLAQKGRALYVQLFSDVSVQQQIDAALAEPTTIHVAHLLAEKVLPWSALYDRHYDANRSVDAAGRTVAHEACTAMLSEPREVALKLKCGEHEKCVLHPARLTDRAVAGQPGLLPETVVCPLRFWGFRHVIEVPAQQTTPDGSAPPEQLDRIEAGEPINVVAGLHEGLNLTEEHSEYLKTLFALPQASLRSGSDRDAVITLLDDAQIDIAYFYCHARGGDVEGGPEDEVIELGLKGAEPRKIAPGDLGPVVWGHHPIVIINGCHTAGFSPQALSPFVRVFMGRRAAGVIGTEIDVWEELAGEFLKLFMEDFLNGTTAGDALQRVRLALLARNNPLGLVYTLYAGAHLTLGKRITPQKPQ